MSWTTRATRLCRSHFLLNACLSEAFGCGPGESQGCTGPIGGLRLCGHALLRRQVLLPRSGIASDGLQRPGFAWIPRSSSLRMASVNQNCPRPGMNLEVSPLNFAIWSPVPCRCWQDLSQGHSWDMAETRDGKALIRRRRRGCPESSARCAGCSLVRGLCAVPHLKLPSPWRRRLGAEGEWMLGLSTARAVLCTFKGHHRCAGRGIQELCEPFRGGA